LLGFMQGAGWTLYDITNLGYYRSDSTFYQCYATFIPKSMDFRKNTPSCTRGQLTEALKGQQQRRAQALRAIDELVG
jgi:hypothetical protein